MIVRRGPEPIDLGPARGRIASVRQHGIVSGQLVVGQQGARMYDPEKTAERNARRREQRERAEA